MVRWALVFLILTVLTGTFGFTGLGGPTAGVGRVLFFIFLICFIVSLLIKRKSIDPPPPSEE